MSAPYAIILAGGSGTRFWPASRRACPKQLLPLIAGSEASLLEHTLARIAPLVPTEQLLIATSTRLREQTRARLPGLPESAVLAEPVARNTAPCIGWATATIARRAPEAVVMVLPSDHYVADTRLFRETVERACALAATGSIVTIGLWPTRPETGYGYIELGPPLDQGRGDTFLCQKFVEKPDPKTALEFVTNGRHLWNSGMFFFRADVLLQRIGQHLPSLAAALAEFDRAAAAGEEEARLAELFPELPNVSIDVGIMERESQLLVIKGDFGWNDLGSFASLWELGPRDGAGNVAAPNHVLIDAERNLILSRTDPTRTVALLGVSDLCVIDTPDALLIVPRERAQDVREVLRQLEAAGRDDLS
jgi:mannose-1-phosphate guanylyltransferase